MRRKPALLIADGDGKVWMKALPSGKIYLEGKLIATSKEFAEVCIEIGKKYNTYRHSIKELNKKIDETDRKKENYK